MPREYFVGVLSKLSGGITSSGGDFPFPQPRIYYQWLSEELPDGERRWVKLRKSFVISLLLTCFDFVWFFCFIAASALDRILLKTFDRLGWLNLLYRSRFNISGKTIRRPSEFSSKRLRGIFEVVCSHFEIGEIQDDDSFAFYDYSYRRIETDEDRVIAREVADFLVKEGALTERYRLVIESQVSGQIIPVYWDKEGRFIYPEDRKNNPFLTLEKMRVLVGTEYAKDCVHNSVAEKVTLTKDNFRKVWIRADYAQEKSY